MKMNHFKSISRYVMSHCVSTVTRSAFFPATATDHTDLLVMEANLFHKIIPDYKLIHGRITMANQMRCEYMESPMQALKQNLRSKSQETESRGICSKIYHKLFGAVINHDSHFYRLYNYLVSVHACTMSGLYSMYVAFIHPDILETTQKSIFNRYVLDFVILTRIYVEMHVTYIDRESRQLIDDLRLIRRRYLRSKFFFDVFISLPLNTIIYYMFTYNWKVTRYFLFNRMMRVFYIFIYYNQLKLKMLTKVHLRWTFCIYTILIYLQFLVCLW